MTKNKKFIPKRYIKNKINRDNCNHELLITSCFYEPINIQNYKCLICDRDIDINTKEKLKNSYVYYGTNGSIEEIFLKKLIRYISIKFKKEKSIDISKIFKELEPVFEKITSCLNEQLEEAETMEKKSTKRLNKNELCENK